MLLDARVVGGVGGGAPLDATFITQTPNATLTNEQSLSLLATGILKSTAGTGVLSIGIPTVDFASAAQGALADTAVQPATLMAGLATKQPLDVTLTAYAALVGAADKLPYFTGVDVFALADLTAFGRSLVDDADAAAALTTLTAAGLTAANTFTAAQMVDGSADVVQLIVEGAGTQTAAIQVWQTTGGTVRSSVDSLGYGWRMGDSQARGNISIGAAAASNNFAIQIDRSIAAPSVNIYGITGEMMVTGAVTITEVAGVSFSGRSNHTSGTIGRLVGAAFTARNTSTGIVTAGYGLRVQSGGNSGGGTLSTLYGIVIEAQTAGAANYALISAGVANCGIGLTAPLALLHIAQTSTTAAKPVLRLNQADLSEEFIRFETTVGAGNAIDTAALGAYYGKARVYVEGVGAKWLALYN